MFSFQSSDLNTEHRTLNTAFTLLTLSLLAAFAPRAEAVSATGGTVTNYTSGIAPNQTNWTAHIFTTAGTNVGAFQVSGGGDVEYLIVGGGGGGGAFRGGGGGAGGYRSNVGGTPLTISGSSNYTIVVGNGGTGGAFRNTNPGGYDSGVKGEDSSFAGILAAGGGGGAPGLASHASFLNILAGVAGGNGGSGGGGSGYGDGGTRKVGAGGSGNFPSTSPAQGNDGGAGPAAGNSSGSGGGAGAPGSNASWANGGNGLANTISGTSVYYAGGGGSGTYAHDGGTSGGLGGGGAGGNARDNTGQPYNMPTNGTPNTGGGGGGGGNPSVAAVTPGAAGGSGIVIVRYVTESSLPAMGNDGVTVVTTGSATLNGTLTSTGGAACAVCVLWGETSGGATWNWAKTNWLTTPVGGWTNNSPLSKTITSSDGLLSDKTYYYTYAATNSTTNAVASIPKSFITGYVTVQPT
ncbi:MAG: glycine-rich domain-containing protein, partial [Kiritimatiellia bacterium]